METTIKDVLQNIIDIRKQKGFSQEYVAENLGMKQAGYALIEKGSRGLSLENLLQIAIILEIDIHLLFKSKNNEYAISEEKRVSIVAEMQKSYDNEYINSLKNNIESLQLNVKLLTEKLNQK